MKLDWLKRWARKCVRAIATLICVLIVFFTYVQQDPWLARTIEQQVDGLMNQWCDCRFHADLDSVQFLRGCITLKNCAATHPTDATQWSWNVQQVTLLWSWTDLLAGRKCAVTCVIEGVDCHSLCKKDDAGIQLAIMPHLILLTAPPAIEVPFIMNGCKISDFICDIHEPLHNAQDRFSLKAKFSGEVALAADATRVAARFEQCCFSQGATTYLQNGEGKATLFIPDGTHQDQKLHYTFDASCTMPLLPQKISTLKFQGDGSDSGPIGTFSNDDQSLHGHVTLEKSDVHCNVTIPFLANKSDAGCTINITYNHEQQTCDIDVPALTVEEFLQGVTALYKAHATITPESLEIACSSTNNHYMECICALKPTIDLKKFKYGDGQTELMTCTGKHEGFGGEIPYVTVRRLTQLAGFDLQGTGECHYSGSLLPTGVQLQFDMPQANIRVPMTYSIIQKVSGNVVADWASRTMTFHNGVIDVYKGKVLCSQAKVFFDEQGGVTYMHLPLMIQKCFFGWRKDFFAQISGGLMVTYSPQAIKLEGACMIDQAYVRGNPLSAEFQRDFFESALSSLNAGASSSSGISDTVVCDVEYTTKTPLEIKTPFLEGAVTCQGHCTGTIGNPHVTGKLEFVRGTLEFPYKPLFITKGEVTLRPEAPEDPSILLVARNHIKKYDIELSVTGTIRNPHISFSSYPHLEQPNIITLLLGGSEDGSLYFLMPKVMTDTLETLLFGSVETTSRVQKYLQALFRPFKSVSLVPRLSDQAGRGGVRGALSIEVNDRLRALIEKNVSLPEDTTFEVEYDISDDSRFRVTRDERGDYGLQGEMRWKF